MHGAMVQPHKTLLLWLQEPYRVTVSDASGCSATSTVTITQPNKALDITSNIVNPTCFGGNNGCIGLDVAYGTGNYSYTWSSTAINSDSICGLAAGTYFVTVSDAVAPGVFCTARDTIVVTQPAALTASALASNATCNGINNGSINLTFAGTGNTFVWSNGSTTEDISGLAVGTYQVTATSSTGCTATTSATITQPSAITSSTVTVTDATCSAGGTVDISASGGTGALTYSWSNGANTQDISGVSAGSYTVTITDANSCTITNGPNVVVAIGTPSASTTVNSVSCNGGNNGSIDLSVNGGTPNYVYAWSNGANTQDISGLAAGNYSVTVTDNIGCTATQTNIVISQPTAITVTNTSANLSCNGSNNGNILVTVSGGTGAYTYQWSNGSTSEDLNNIAAGTYSLTVSDANGCIRNLGPINITQPTALVISNVSTTIANCGQPDGSITLSVNGGTGSYTYNWSNGANTEDINSLAEGSYTLTVTDANGCQVTQIVTVAGSGDISITLTAVDENCGQPNTGSVDLTVSGGTLPLIYNWSNGANTEDINAVSAGTYSVTVTDSDGCTVSDSDIVNSSFQPSLNAGVLNSLATDTTITWGDPTILTGGTAENGVTYAWTSIGISNANFSAADSIVTTVQPDDDGVYQFIITATSADGCVTTDTLNVTVQANNPSIPTAFSPNDDGLNDLFEVVNMKKSFIREFKIYNRWGKLVYDNATEAAWDGKFNGVEQPREVYMYTISWESSTGAGLVLKRGTVTLMR
jgi:gliding motility-associated-like protein